MKFAHRGVSLLFHLTIKPKTLIFMQTGTQQKAKYLEINHLLQD